MHHASLSLAILVALLVGTPRAVPGQEPDPHQAAAQTLFLRCQLGEGGQQTRIQVNLKVPSIRADAVLDQVVAPPAGLPPLRVKRYLVRAIRHQRVVPAGDGEGHPSVHVMVQGPKQSEEVWLVAGDTDRNRLRSLIATWSYVAIPTEPERARAYQKFVSADSRSPTLRVRPTSTANIKEIPVVSGAEERLPELGCTVKILKFYPHFSINRVHEPTNVSNELRNPAVLVRLEYQGRSEERWVLTKLPKFGRSKSGGLPFEVLLDSPVVSDRPVPEYCLVTIGGKRHELWTRYDARCSSASLGIKTKTPIPNSRYAFEIDSYVAQGRLEESYAPATKATGGRTAIEVDLPDSAGGSRRLWLELGRPETVSTAKGPLTLLFDRPKVPVGPGH